MKEMLKMVGVLAALSILSGGVLSYLQNSLSARIENTILEKVQAPTLRKLLEGSENDPVADRFSLGEGKEKKTFFVAKFDGEVSRVVLETKAGGYGGDVGLMVVFDIKEDTITSVDVTTHAETKGIGTKSFPKFTSQFKDLSTEAPIQMSDVSAMSGATVSSVAVVNAANLATQAYNDLKPQILEQIKGFSN